ncbi:hypothetical protein [Microvirga flavescens]|uniref:hypothetical protein n=1 Tax=Microvirga flavescens TaxID=2249811 RepID=UPI000DDA0920|nr:hypothetical protein [Microvirga flavescens]
MNDNNVQLVELEDLSAIKQAALTYVSEAFAEAELDGLDPDCMAQAALFTAFMELVATYGEEAVAQYAASLPERIRGGGFSTALKH